LSLGSNIGFRIQVSGFNPASGLKSGQFDQIENLFRLEKKIKYVVGAASSRDELDFANPVIVAGSHSHQTTISA
jgi:hypothetical protein